MSATQVYKFQHYLFKIYCAQVHKLLFQTGLQNYYIIALNSAAFILPQAEFIALR